MLASTYGLISHRTGDAPAVDSSPENIRVAVEGSLKRLRTDYIERDPEAEILPTVRRLGIAFVAYSPLGRGFVTGQIRSTDQLSPDDFRANNPRFLKGNFEQNMRIVHAVETVATEVAAKPAQVALAWLLEQGDDIVPIPGTKHVFRMEENAAATGITLTAGQVAR